MIRPPEKTARPSDPGLRPFNPKAICIACGAPSAQARFREAATDGGKLGQVDTSFIERRCTRCAYMWRERPLYFFTSGAKL